MPICTKLTANAFNAAFSKKALKVDVIDKCHGENCLNNIDLEKYGCYVEPNILHWEDRNTEWLGKPDRIEIQIIIFDTITKQQLANSSYTGKVNGAHLAGTTPRACCKNQPRNTSIHYIANS